MYISKKIKIAFTFVMVMLFVDTYGQSNNFKATFMVLHKAYMPRVLIETGFVSNTVEGDLLNSEQGQNDIAKAIADAILSYKIEYFGDGGAEIFGEKPSEILKEN